ncbi:MAG: hypothetical protein ACR2P8_01500, partial [Myxococcota bacterium]
LHVAHVLPERPEVLGVARAELELALAPLLRRRVHVRRGLVNGVVVRIDPEAFPERAPEPAPAEEPQPEARGLGGWSLDVEELALSALELEMQRPDLEPLLASLEQLTGKLLWDESLELALAGRYRDFPISGRVEGASLAQLIEGAESWPLRLDAELAGSPIELAARLATVAEVYRVDEMQGRAGDTTISGWLALENLVTKPRASGRIELGAIELVLPEREADKAPAPPTQPRPEHAGPEPAEEEEASPIAVAMGLLRDFETDLELEIEHIAGIGPTVSDLSVALRVAGGELRFPVSLTADEIPLLGTLRVDEVEELPHLFFQLSAEGFRVDTLAATLLPDAKIAGPFEELRLELEGRGDSLLGFLETLRFELGMADAALSYGVERPVPFGVEILELKLAERGPLTLMLRGDLLGERVELDLTGGTVESFLADRPWDLQLDAQGAGATLALSGQAQGTPDDLDVVGDLSIRGERLSSLEPWLGVLPVPDAPYSLLAHIDDTPEQTELRLEEVRLGGTNLAGSLGERRGEGAPLLWANLRIENLDVSPYVEAMRRSRREATAPAETERPVAFDAPILPGGLVIVDADFDLGVGKLRAGDLELADLRFEGAFRDGFLPRSDFGFDVGEARFAGAISADLREAPHDATFSFGTRDVDVGKLLARLGVAEELDVRAGALRIEVRGQGATLGDIVDESDFKARLEDVRWTLRDPNSPGGIALILDEGELVSPRGDAPVRLIAAGSLAGVPVRLESRTEQLSFFKRPEESVPLELELEMAGATLEVSSRVMLPIQRAEWKLELVLSGQSLAHASRLFDYELPPIGPYRLASRLRFTPQDY